MPTYVYACTSCGEGLEAVQKFADEPLTQCPACGGRLRKVFSPVGVVFKGSGFYKTDSRSTSKKPTSDSGAKSDTKPATDTDSASTSKESSKDSSTTSTSTTSTSSSSSSSSGQVA